jgi:hypothetical protein
VKLCLHIPIRTHGVRDKTFLAFNIHTEAINSGTV